MIEIEKRGVPTVGIVSRSFEEDARRTAQVFGVPGLPLAIVPEALTNCPPDLLHEYAELIFQSILYGLTQQGEEAVPSLPPELIAEPTLKFQDDDPLAAVENMNRAFLASGWGDGFPLRPATRWAVDEMVQGTTLGPQERIAVLEPGLGIATVEKIAINAVMAGCRPEHLPVILAAVRAMTDRMFRLRAVACSTGPHTPLLLVNGPIAKRLGINSGCGCLGPGAPSYANTVIGRAIRLVMMNVGHAYLGKLDMDTFGSPNKYSMCLAEDEDSNPWQPLTVDKGLMKGDDAVTVFVARHVLTINNPSNDPVEVLSNIAAAAVGVGRSATGHWIRQPRLPRSALDANRADINDEHYLVLIGPDHARLLAGKGWTKPGIREFLHVKAVTPFWKGLTAGCGRAELRDDWKWLWDAPDTPIPVSRTPESFHVAVAGGSGPKSLFVGGGHHAITVRIEV